MLSRLEYVLPQRVLRDWESLTALDVHVVHTHIYIVDEANKRYTHIIQHEIFFDVHFSMLFMTKTF